MQDAASLRPPSRLWVPAAQSPVGSRGSGHAEHYRKRRDYSLTARQPHPTGIPLRNTGCWTKPQSGMQRVTLSSAAAIEPAVLQLCRISLICWADAPCIIGSYSLCIFNFHPNLEVQRLLRISPEPLAAPSGTVSSITAMEHFRSTAL